MHADNDMEVLPLHSEALWSVFAEELIPPRPRGCLIDSRIDPQSPEWQAYYTKFDKIMAWKHIPNYGRLRELVRPNGQPVWYLRTLARGHDGIIEDEGSSDIIFDNFELSGVV